MRFICTATMMNIASSANSRGSLLSQTGTDRFISGYDEQGAYFRFINDPTVAIPFAFGYPHTSQTQDLPFVEPIYHNTESNYNHDQITMDHQNDINQFGEEWLHSFIQYFLRSDVILKTSADNHKDEIAIGCEALQRQISADYYQLSFQFPLETLLWLRIICPSSDEFLQQIRIPIDSQTLLNTMDTIKQRIDTKNLPYIDSFQFSADKLNKLRAKWFRARQAFVKDFRDKSGIFQTSTSNPYPYKDVHDHQSTVASSPKTSNNEGAQITPSDTNKAFIDSILKSFYKAPLQSYEVSKYDHNAEDAVRCNEVIQFLAESTSDIDPISKDMAMMMMIICPSYAQYVDTTFSFSVHELQEGYLNIMHLLYKHYGHIDVAKQQLLNQLAEVAIIQMNWNVEIIEKLKETPINCDPVRESLADYHGYLLNETAVGLIIFCPGNGTQEEIMEIKQFTTNKEALAQGTKLTNKWTEALLAKESQNRYEIKPKYRPLMQQ